MVVALVGIVRATWSSADLQARILYGAVMARGIAWGWKGGKRRWWRLCGAACAAASRGVRSPGHSRLAQGPIFLTVLSGGREGDCCGGDGGGGQRVGRGLVCHAVLRKMRATREWRRSHVVLRKMRATRDWRRSQGQGERSSVVGPLVCSRVTHSGQESHLHA